MIFRGKVWKLGDNVNTDLIIAGRYKYDTLDMRELAKHAFEDLDPNLSRKIRPGDIIVAGRNFGCGSSREQAPEVIKALGVRVIIAESIARIFLRNAVNIGLIAIEIEGISKEVENGQELEVDVERGIVRIPATDKVLKFRPWPRIMREIFKAGGLIDYIKKGGRI
ncbi:3-isopropylmalate dehydratase [Candidatus Geothermarchaeota archaeon]|nr:MAG: 3-isopropylmalate dehydratase [Candidatus Geothermarchaeota archaeon]